MTTSAPNSAEANARAADLARAAKEFPGRDSSRWKVVKISE